MNNNTLLFRKRRTTSALCNNFNEFSDAMYVTLEYESVDDFLACKKWFKSSYDPRMWYSELPNLIHLNRKWIEKYAMEKEFSIKTLTTKSVKYHIPSIYREMVDELLMQPRKVL